MGYLRMAVKVESTHIRTAFTDLLSPVNWLLSL